MTDAPGTYALVLRADRHHAIVVGRLGRMTVRPGFSVYVGSAFGPGGLAARVGRHARGDGKRRWHVDHLRAVTRLEEAWFTTDPVHRECDWAAVMLAWPGAEAPLRGFGASDCSCRTHLVELPERPSVTGFRRRVRRRIPDHGQIRVE